LFLYFLSFASLFFIKIVLYSIIDEYPKPLIIEEPKSQLSTKGGNVTLVCRATSTADAPLHFTWKHDNVELDDANLQISTGSTEDGATEATSSLHLVNVTYADAGKYQCMVTNNYGTTYSSKAKLSVLGKLFTYCS
jgi:hypothetical protein